MKNKYRVLLFISLFTLLLNACAVLDDSSTLETHRVSENGIDMVMHSSESGAAFFQTESSQESYCLSPASDAVPVFSDGSALSTIGDSLGFSAAQGSAILGGRSPFVLVVRELMYRNCELSLNKRLSKEESIKMFELTLQIVRNISESQSGSGTSDLGVSELAPTINVQSNRNNVGIDSNVDESN